MHVSLTARQNRFIRTKVASGGYNNASEVVREALRLLEEHDALKRARLRRLRAAIAEGDADLAAGRTLSFDSDRDIREFVARL